MLVPKVIPKTFHYTNDLAWQFNRVGTMTSEGKPEMKVSSPQEFKGDAGYWTPEDLFVAAANSCLMLTLLAYLERENIAVLFYESKATGTLEWVEGIYQFTEITIIPRLELVDTSYAQRAEELLLKAESTCLIANSIRARVNVEPHILAVDD